MSNISPEQDAKIEQIANLVMEITLIDIPVLSDLIVKEFGDIPLPPDAYDLIMSRVRALRRRREMAKT